MSRAAADAMARALRLVFAGDPILLGEALSIHVVRRDSGSVLAAFLPSVGPGGPLLVLNDRAPFAVLSAGIARAAAHQVLDHRSLAAYCYTVTGPLAIPAREDEEAHRFVLAFLGHEARHTAA